jgi:hypothetical protein
MCYLSPKCDASVRPRNWRPPLLVRQEPAVKACIHLRTFLRRSLLLVVEFLVAGDIIKTVANLAGDAERAT